jgi:hypothetical protein
MVYAAISCPLCADQFKQELKLNKHLQLSHDVTDVEALYVKHVLNNIRPRCACCETCDASIRWGGWKKGFISKYARGHNARVDSIYNNPTFQKQAAKKRKSKFSQGAITVWNKGLSKTDDDRIASAAQKISRTLKDGYSSGRLIDWRSKDEHRAKFHAKKVSLTKQKLFAEGKLNIWNAGLTKETDARLAQAATKISLAYQRREVGRRLTRDELKRRVEAVPQFELLSSIDDYRMRRIQRLAFRCRTCNNVISKSLAMLEDTPICFFCHPKESTGQLELFQFVKEIAPTTVLSDRTIINPKELDIVVPGKLAIEYDGLWWHSELFLRPDYADRKFSACQDAGIRLLRVFEDEWRDKRELVQQMIMHRLGLNRIVIGARSCELVELKLKERRAFFNAYHLDGDVKARTALGLKFRGELVAAMSLRRPFHKTHANFSEVARFAQKPGISVAGALSRLSKRAVKLEKDRGKQGLLTYVDHRVGDGQSYVKAGFKIVTHSTGPRFWWTDFKHRYGRFKFKADRTQGLSERDVAQREGVVKIWGCSNLMLTLE